MALEAWAGPAIARRNYPLAEREQGTDGSTIPNIAGAPHIRTALPPTGLGAQHAAIHLQTARQVRDSSLGDRVAISQAIALQAEPA